MNCETSVRPEEDRELSGLSVCQCGQEACAPGHSFGPAVRDFYMIHYALRGRGVFHSGGVRYDLGAGDGFLITPYKSTYYAADQNDPWEYRWIGFRGTQAPGLLRRCGLSEQNPVFHYELEDASEQAPEQYLNVIYRDSPRVCGQDYEMLGHLYQFMACLMRNHSRQTGPQAAGGRELTHARRAADYIEKNYFEELTVEEIAAHIGLNRSHLYKLFVAEYGMSVQDYIRQQRLAKAQYLLANTALPVNEIALSCGFSDQSYFSRCFRQRYGQVPLAYRKRLISRQIPVPPPRT